jgi:hypothetical protein
MTIQRIKMKPAFSTLIRGGLAVMFLLTATGVATPAAGAEPSWEELRRAVAWRQRRIIVNNDGNDATGPMAPGEEKTPEAS